jgi:hypothetical protein
MYPEPTVEPGGLVTLSLLSHQSHGPAAVSRARECQGSVVAIGDDLDRMHAHRKREPFHERSIRVDES